MLKQYGIEATSFSRLRGNADSEFNNRSHRKITVIDGKIGYTLEFRQKLAESGRCSYVLVFYIPT